MSFLISSIETKNTDQQNNFWHKGMNAGTDFQYFMAGDIFEPTISISEVHSILKSDKEIPSLEGEFSLCIADDDTIYVINDEIGTLKWFYYYGDDGFILSNNFWEIADIKQLGLENLSDDAIYEYFIMLQSLQSKTFFKDIKVVPPGVVFTYSKKDSLLKITKYADISYQSDLKSINKEDIFDQIDLLLAKTIKKITDINKNCSIGVTVSGGLDSRFPLPYIQDLPNKKISYLIGIHKGFLEAFDFKSAKRMSNMYKMKLKLVNPFELDMQKKILIDIARNPLSASNILKAIDKSRAFAPNEDFNILLTGAYGGLIGGRVLNKALLNSKESLELAKNLFFDYSQLKHINRLESGYSNWWFLKEAFARLTKLFFNKHVIDVEKNKNISITHFLDSDFLIPKNKKQKTFEEIFEFVKTEKNNNKNNLSIIMKVHLYRHSIRGAFESLHGQVKAYSIYHPYIYEYSKTWPVSFLENRSIMEEFLLNKHELLAKVPLQSYDLPIHYRYRSTGKMIKIALKLYALFNFTVRGLAINYNSWWKKKEVRTLVKTTFADDNAYFYKLFRKSDVLQMLEYPRYSLLNENLLKLFIMIKMIEKKDYKTLLDIDVPESDKL